MKKRIISLFAIAFVLFSCEIAEDDNKLLVTDDSTIVCFGDSLTAGYGAGINNAYPAKLQEKINIPIINSGVSGDTTDDALSRIDLDVISHHPIIVLIELGANDYFYGSYYNDFDITNVENNYREIITSISNDNCLVYLVKFYNEDAALEILDNDETVYNQFELMYSKLKKEFGIKIIDSYWNGIWGNEDLMSDSFHPNELGYEIAANNIFEKLNKILVDNNLLK